MNEKIRLYLQVPCPKLAGLYRTLVRQGSITFWVDENAVSTWGNHCGTCVLQIVSGTLPPSDTATVGSVLPGLLALKPLQLYPLKKPSTGREDPNEGKTISQAGWVQWVGCCWEYDYG